MSDTGEIKPATKRKAGEIDKEIGDNIRKFRRRSEMSQAALGQAIGVSFQQIQKFEKGTNRVSAPALVEISKALGVSPMMILPPMFEEFSKTLADAAAEWISDAQILFLRNPKLFKELVALPEETLESLYVTARVVNRPLQVALETAGVAA